jgi:hypothetical protein
MNWTLETFVKRSAFPAEGGKGRGSPNHEDDDEKEKTGRYDETCSERKGPTGDIELALIRATRRHLPEDYNHHSHRRGNLKSYMAV